MMSLFREKPGAYGGCWIELKFCISVIGWGERPVTSDDGPLGRLLFTDLPW
jgi:hypothetical protein